MTLAGAAVTKAPDALAALEIGPAGLKLLWPAGRPIMTNVDKEIASSDTISVPFGPKILAKPTVRRRSSAPG